MNIERINISQLEEFIHTRKYLSYGIVPITPERAWSQTKNPHAKPDDPALWVALDDSGDLLGFIGSLPAKDYRSGERMGWNTCWWADPEKGRDAAMPLFYTFLKHWDMQVAFSDMTAHTYSIISQMGFCHTRQEQVCIAYLRFPLKEILHSAKRLTFILSPVLTIPAVVINLFQALRISTAGNNLKGLEMEIQEEPGEEVWGFIRQYHAHEFTGRRKADFAWITIRKWLSVNSGNQQDMAERYPFSYLCEVFEWKWIITRQDGKIQTVMFVSLRDHVLKVLYFYGESPGFALMALKLLVSQDHRINKIIFGHPRLIRNRRLLNSVLILKRLKKRYTGVSKQLLDEFPRDMVMQLGDGDAVFT